jgi:hypothetical protein
LNSVPNVVLTCVPKPSVEAMQATIARARGRQVRLLKSTGQALVGDSQLAMQDLVSTAKNDEREFRWRARRPAATSAGTRFGTGIRSWLDETGALLRNTRKIPSELVSVLDDAPNTINARASQRENGCERITSDHPRISF